MSATDGAPLARRVTTSDVARASGFSRATVSYVLNDVQGRGISKATREHVLATAQRLGHIPNGPARSLRTGRSNVVLALVRDYTIGYVADRLTEELDRRLAERGFVLMVNRFDETVRTLSELWGLVAPDLVVAMGGLPVPQLPEGSPVRLLGVQGVFPHRRGSEMQIRYLVETGHERIGYAAIDNPRVELISAERISGARDTVAELGLPPLVERTIALGDAEAALAAVDAWTTGPDRVTAVAAHNDEMALMLMGAMRFRGFEVGRDLAIIGIDNIPLARVNVTTIEINVERYTEMTIDRVMRAIDGEAPEAHPSPVEDESLLRLIVRESA